LKKNEAISVIIFPSVIPHATAIERAGNSVSKTNWILCSKNSATALTSSQDEKIFLSDKKHKRTIIKIFLKSQKKLEMYFYFS